MNDIINQAIAEAEIPQAQEATIEPATEEVVSTETEGDAPQAKVEEDTPFPKKAINALSRRDKKIGSLEARLADKEAQLAKYLEAQTPKDNTPKEEAFDNYGEYLLAVARHEAKQEFEAGNKKAEEGRVSEQEKAWTAQREQFVVDKSRELIQSNPEVLDLVMESADIIDSYPPAIQRVFLEADNAPLAFVTLAKEGRLEELATMTPARAAMEIARAELRAETHLKPKQVTKAPQPLASAKGTGSGAKSLDDMSGDDIRKWLKS